MAPMETVEVKIAGSGKQTCYPVLIGDGILADLPALVPLSRYSKIALVIDRNIAAKWQPRLMPLLPAGHALIEIAATETTKSVDQLNELWVSFLSHGLD